jgi:CelD/BcsL family acetyltransferase involved in cellulose biosynthesis
VSFTSASSDVKLGVDTRVDVITDPHRFLSMEAEWNDLLRRSGATYPFLRHEWLRTWWDCLAGSRRMHVLLVRSAGRLVAAAPLMEEEASMYGIPIRRLALIQNDHAPRADFLVDEEHSDSAYRAIWTSLSRVRDRWDILQLSQLPSVSRTSATIARLATTDGCMTGIWPSGDSPYLELHGTWEQYVAALSAKFRQNLRNRLGRLRRAGEPALEVIGDTVDLHSDCDEAIRLESSGWKRNEGTAIMSDSALYRFYIRFARIARERGWLRLLFLTLNGRRIAVAYSLVFENRLFLCKTGYDPEFATASPFKVLTYFAIRYAFETGCMAVDFLGDPEPWKIEWTTSRMPHDWLFVFSNSRRARLLYPLKFQLVPALKKSPLASFVNR